jgi:hypothetical protein
MAGFPRAKSRSYEQYQAWRRAREEENRQNTRSNSGDSGIFGVPGVMRAMPDPRDPRYTAGEVYQPVNIPGLPPAVTPFKADPARQGGVQWVGTPMGPARAVQNLSTVAADEEAGRAQRWYEAKMAGIEPVSRGDADLVRVRDSQILTDRLEEAGRWVPTSDADAQRLEQMAARVQNVATGSNDAPRRADAPLRRRLGQIRAEEIDQVIAALEAQGVTDAREDPRFREMEEAALFVRGVPRRETYAGDPSQIEGQASGGGSWGGISPYGPVELLTSDARGRISRVNVYPGESTGQVRTIDPDATAIWDKEEDPTLGKLAQEARGDARTGVITALALQELARSRRFREATPSELQVLAPARGKAQNTLKGFMVQAGSRPYGANQLLEDLEKGKITLSIGNGGSLTQLDPERANALLSDVVNTALDPNNPRITIGQGGRFGRDSSLPELYVQRGGDIRRLAMGMSPDGAPSLLVREWAPVYDPGVETQVEVAKRNSLGQPIVVPQNTALYRVGRATNQDNAAVKQGLAEILPGAGTATQLSPLMGVRPLVQRQQRGEFDVLMRDAEGVRVLAPQEVEAQLSALVGRAMSPDDPMVAVDQATGMILPGQGATRSNPAPQVFVRRPDGRTDRIVLSVRPGPNPEPLVRLPGQQVEVGPTFLNSDINVRMTGAKRDPDQDLYPVMNELTGAAFAEGAPVASTQRVTRELMAGLVRDKGYTPVEAANTVLGIVAQQSESPTVRMDYRNAVKSALIELTGGESRLGPEVAVEPASYTGLAAVLDFARGLNQRERSGRVVPLGDVRERIRPRVRLAEESGEANYDPADEMRDPIQRALQDEMAARDFGGYSRGGSTAEDDLNDLDSDAYVNAYSRLREESGLTGESPRGVNEVDYGPSLTEIVAAGAYEPLSSSSLAGRRSMSESGPIDRALRKQAELLAEAAIRAGGATARPTVTQQVINTPEGPRIVRARGEEQLPGRTPAQMREAAARMANPPIREGLTWDRVNYGSGWY